MALYEQLCEYDNLFHAYEKARKGKTLKRYVIQFEEQLKENLLQLQQELKTQTYKPKPLDTFIIRDPKTRKISKSDFRDRIVHHAICNIIEPLFDKTFIYDSYANRKGKGTLKAIKRFEKFQHIVSQNNTRPSFVLKADVKHYFETVDHNILIMILKKIIKEEKTINLVKNILNNHKTEQEGKGMPLGNLTSQFFANIYLNELDQFIKHQLKAKHYIRYVDDFVIVHHSRKTLEEHQGKIQDFLATALALQLHPDKSKIIRIQNGVNFLGYRLFPKHKLLRKKNMWTFEKKMRELCKEYEKTTRKSPVTKGTSSLVQRKATLFLHTNSPLCEFVVPEFYEFSAFHSGLAILLNHKRERARRGIPSRMARVC